MLVALISLSMSANSQQFEQTCWPKETVLAPGQSLSVTNRSGTMVIAFVSSLKRRYSWNGVERTVNFIPRKERWYGALGIYSPEPLLFSFWKADGVSRILAQEAELNFKSEGDFLKWHNGEWNRDRINVIYNDSGIAAGWGKSPSREQLNVDVWQILLNGKIPKHLSGANNSAIKLTTESSKGIRQP